jgi:gliding motility-associated-like protein
VLQVNQVDTIKFTIKVTPYNDMMGPFNNSAKAIASSPAGTNVEDISTNGLNPDTNNDGDPNEDVPTSVMLEKVTVRIPEGFSPNGDGVNDNFVIENLDSESISLEVFNQFGNLVYKNINYHNEWSGISNQGSYSGKEIPNGTYYYIVSKRNHKETYQKYITINR